MTQNKPKSHQFPTKFKKLDRFFTDLCTDYGKSDIFDTLKISKALDVFIICTSQSVARQGIGHLLLQESLKVGKTNGFEAIQCMALSLFTQKICLKQNFEELYSIAYAEYLQKNQKLFNEQQMAPHVKGVFYARKL